MAEFTFLLALQALNYQGQNILGESWADFLLDLRHALAVKGKEDPASTESLLLFYFTQPETACVTLLESLARLKKVYEWKETFGPLPLHIVLHLEKEGEPPGPEHDPVASFWDLLQHEQPHATPILKQQWPEGQAGENLLSHTYAEAGNGLYLLFVHPEIPHVEIFPHCALPLPAAPVLLRHGYPPACGMSLQDVDHGHPGIAPGWLRPRSLERTVRQGCRPRKN
jgi:hypothetical protein